MGSLLLSLLGVVLVTQALFFIVFPRDYYAGLRCIYREKKSTFKKYLNKEKK